MLKTHLSKWKDIYAQPIMFFSVRKKGYRIPFKHVPPSVVLSKNKSARDNVSIVYLEIQKLIEKDCVTQVIHIPFVVNHMTVAFNKSGKPRLVLDCRHINKSIHEFVYRMEDIRSNR